MRPMRPGDELEGPEGFQLHRPPADVIIREMHRIRFEDLAPEATDSSPWGTIQMATNIADGVVFVSTPSHGGFWLSCSRRDQVPAIWRRYAARWSKGWGDQWYEEDCAACAVVATFPDLFPDPQVVKEARAVLESLMSSGKLTGDLSGAGFHVDAQYEPADGLSRDD